MKYGKSYSAANACKISAVKAKIQESSSNHFKHQGYKDYLNQDLANVGYIILTKEITQQEFFRERSRTSLEKQTKKACKGHYPNAACLNKN